MILLPNGCSCSDLSVCPKNWKDKGASTEKDWYIFFRFYDPNFNDKFPNGKPVIVKKGLNYFKDIEERRQLVKQVIAGTLDKLKILAFNPITGTVNSAAKPYDHLLQRVENEQGISPETPIFEALVKSFERLSGKKYVSKGTKVKRQRRRQEDLDTSATSLADSMINDIKSMLHFLGESITTLGMQELPVKDASRKFLRLIIDGCGRSVNRTNKYRTNLIILFNELIEMEIVEHNPAEKLKKGKTIKRRRLTLSREERIKIDCFLKHTHQTLWRFMHIFFHSGARKTELFRLKGRDVDLNGQTIALIVKKGRQYSEVQKVIKDIAMPFWREQMKDCGEEDYVFSWGLVPGPEMADPDYVNKLWKKLVKDNPDLGEIAADFYSLKHIHTTEVSAAIGHASAAEHNSHTSVAMEQQVYDVEYQARQNKTVKTMDNAFA